MDYTKLLLKVNNLENRLNSVEKYKNNLIEDINGIRVLEIIVTMHEMISKLTKQIGQIENHNINRVKLRPQQCNWPSNIWKEEVIGELDLVAERLNETAENNEVNVQERQNIEGNSLQLSDLEEPGPEVRQLMQDMFLNDIFEIDGDEMVLDALNISNISSISADVRSISDDTGINTDDNFDDDGTISDISENIFVLTDFNESINSISEEIANILSVPDEIDGLTESDEIFLALVDIENISDIITDAESFPGNAIEQNFDVSIEENQNEFGWRYFNVGNGGSNKP